MQNGANGEGERMIITWTVCEIDAIQGQKVLQRREMHMGKRCRGERCKGEPDKEKCMGGGGVIGCSGQITVFPGFIVFLKP